MRQLRPVNVRFLFGFSLCLCVAPVLAAGAHVHGQGELGIAVESGQVDIFLTAPEADLIKEHHGQSALAARFARDAIFIFPEASCQLESSEVAPAAVTDSFWEEADSENHDHHDEPGESDHSEHADYQLIWTYRCSGDPKLLKVTLFADTHLERIVYQAIGPSGVHSGTLTPNSPEIELP